MNKTFQLVSLVFLLLCCQPRPLCAAAPRTAEWKTISQWTFNREGDAEGWRANSDFAEVKVGEGVLGCRAVGHDPIIQLEPLIDIPASPRQALEVRIKADRDGTAEWFWSNTNQGRFGGFSQEMTVRFQVRGDGQWHTHRVFPGWHPEQKIVKFRFDLYDNARFLIDSIRVIELSDTATAEKGDYDFSSGQHGWQSALETSVSARSRTLFIDQQSSTGFVLGPSVRLDAADKTYLSLRMSVSKGRHGTIHFASSKRRGLQTLGFPIVADGQEHTYNIDMLGAEGWQNEIVALGLQPSDAPGASATLHWLKVSDQPQGNPELKVLSCGIDEAIARAGRPLTFSAVVSNQGGQSARAVRAKLILPQGFEVNEAEVSSAAAITFEDEYRFTWNIRCPQPQTGEARVELFSSNALPLQVKVPVAVTATLDLFATDYVPQPAPARGKYEVGVYYFPGWNDAGRWARIQPFPERKPVLGWYREGDPEVADWHIKWAVEHGITYFAYDWYWSKGARQLEHGLDAYFKSRYHHLLKFCLLWANHNPPHSSSKEDCLAVARFWIEHYFHRPEHLTIGGKPVMIIFSPHRLTEDLGSAGVKESFEAMRAECRKSGLPGLYLIACVHSAGQAQRAAEEGYDAVSAYNWPGLGLTGASKFGSYESLIEGYQRNWEQILDKTPIPLVLPISGGWDSRPWHGENNLVRFGRTPELFKRHLEEARRLQTEAAATALLPKHVLIEAWNEWGEGSYIEPHKEFGFGYLDAIRDVFTDAPRQHADVIPADINRGPYDIVASPKKLETEWNFASGGIQGWGESMGLAKVGVTDGALTGLTVNRDAAFFSPSMRAPASNFRVIRVQMRLRREDGQAFADGGQVFWQTTRENESETTSARFEVHGDGQWHEYEIPVNRNRRWRGLIKGLRLDPCTQSNVRVEIRSIRLAQ